MSARWNLDGLFPERKILPGKRLYFAGQPHHTYDSNHIGYVIEYRDGKNCAVGFSHYYELVNSFDGLSAGVYSYLDYASAKCKVLFDILTQANLWLGSKPLPIIPGCHLYTGDTRALVTQAHNRLKVFIICCAKFTTSVWRKVPVDICKLIVDMCKYWR